MLTTLVAALGLSASASAVTVVPIPTSFGLGADTHVNLGTSDGLNRGTSIANGVQTQFAGANTTNIDSANTARPLLRFDLGALPAGVVTDAELIFAVRFVTDQNISISVRALDEADPQDAAPGAGGWLESGPGGVTGASAPTATTPIGTKVLTEEVRGLFGANTTIDDPAPTLLSFFGEPGAAKQNLVDALNADTNGLLTLMMFSNSAAIAPLPAFSFWSKEGAADGIAAAVAPTLLVTVSPVPLPGALGLMLGAIGFGLMAARDPRRAPAAADRRD